MRGPRVRPRGGSTILAWQNCSRSVGYCSIQRSHSCVRRNGIVEWKLAVVDREARADDFAVEPQLPHPGPAKDLVQAARSQSKGWSCTAASRSTSISRQA